MSNQAHTPANGANSGLGQDSADAQGLPDAQVAVGEAPGGPPRPPRPRRSSPRSASETPRPSLPPPIVSGLRPAAGGAEPLTPQPIATVHQSEPVNASDSSPDLLAGSGAAVGGVVEAEKPERDDEEPPTVRGDSILAIAGATPAPAGDSEATEVAAQTPRPAGAKGNDSLPGESERASQPVPRGVSFGEEGETGDEAAHFAHPPPVDFDDIEAPSQEAITGQPIAEVGQVPPVAVAPPSDAAAVSALEFLPEPEAESDLASEVPTARPPSVGGLAADLNQAVLDGATIQLPMRPWVDEVPEEVTPVGAMSPERPSSPGISSPTSSLSMPPSEALQGRVLANRYLVEELLIQSEAGTICRAYHLGLDQPVLLQVLPRGLTGSEAVCAEVMSLAKRAHQACPEHIEDCLDYGVLHDGWPYLVTPKHLGQPLSVLLQSEGKFVLRRVLHVGQQIAQAVDAVRQQGTLHGHLHTDRIALIDPGTPAEVVKVSGFGLSSAQDDAARAVVGTRRDIFGSPYYLSPEQAASRPSDARSDVYALGVILYEMMAGSPPFAEGDFDDILCQHLDDEPSAPSQNLKSPGALAKALDAVILRCLRKDAALRYQTAGDVLLDLQRLEAAAARSRRRPMQEVAKPQSTIHTPVRRSDEPQLPDAKVIVGESSAPMRPAAKGKSSDTMKPRKVSRFQETVRLSAKDVERAIARRKGGWARWVVEAQTAWESVAGWVSRAEKAPAEPPVKTLPDSAGNGSQSES